MRHLRNLWDLDGESIVRIVESGAAIKRSIRSGHPQPLLRGKVLGLLFEKPSLRTRTRGFARSGCSGSVRQAMPRSNTTR